MERGDFCHATSSRSTKLVHGGVRYLAQGNIRLVRDALRERGRLLRNAPSICHRVPLIVPASGRFQKLFYSAGLEIYDLMSGRLGLGATRLLSTRDVVRRLPTINPRGLRGGVLFYDGQFDDARLGIVLALEAQRFGAVPVNYVEVTALLTAAGKIAGALVRDTLGGDAFEVEASVVVNATGVGSDRIRRMADNSAEPRLALSRGSHIVLSGDFLASDHALLVPKTVDGRVLFAIPWHGRTLVGTTDVPVEGPDDEPVPSPEEIAFILDHLHRHFDRRVEDGDILSVFAGLRPLLKPAVGAGRATATLSRDHAVEVLRGTLISTMGGKWTTFRKMAEDTVDRVIAVGGFEAGPSVTAKLPLDGDRSPRDACADTDQRSGGIRDRSAQDPEPGELLHPSLPYRKADIVRAVDQEWAWTLEDVLARRTRCLLLDARATSEAAPEAARLMGEILGLDVTWRNSQVERLQTLAKKYLPSSP